jgi:hypothetical protein
MCRTRTLRNPALTMPQGLSYEAACEVDLVSAARNGDQHAFVEPPSRPLGARPGLAFLYTHFSRVIRMRDAEMSCAGAIR